MITVKIMHVNFVETFSVTDDPKCSSHQIQYKGAHLEVFEAVRGRWYSAGCWENCSLLEHWINSEGEKEGISPDTRTAGTTRAGPAVTAAQAPTQSPWATITVFTLLSPDTYITSEPIGDRKQAPLFKCDISI